MKSSELERIPEDPLRSFPMSIELCHELLSLCIPLLYDPMKKSLRSARHWKILIRLSHNIEVGEHNVGELGVIVYGCLTISE